MSSGGQSPPALDAITFFATIEEAAGELSR